MAVQFTSLAGCKVEAGLQKTNLINSVAHLFKAGASPTPSTVLADLTARECDFDGYTAKTIAAWTGPFLAPGTPGYMLIAPTQEWVYTTPVGTPVPNSVMGYYLVDAGGHLIDVVIFDSLINMSVVDQVIAYTPAELFAAQ